MDGAPQTPFVMSKPKTVLARLHAQGSLEVKHFIPYGIRYFLTRSLLRRARIFLEFSAGQTRPTSSGSMPLACVPFVPASGFRSVWVAYKVELNSLPVSRVPRDLVFFRKIDIPSSSTNMVASPRSEGLVRGEMHDALLRTDRKLVSSVSG